MTIHQRPDIAFLYFFGDIQDPKHSDTPVEKSLTPNPNPIPALAAIGNEQSPNSLMLLEELGKLFPMQVTAQRYRDNHRFDLLIKNGFQEIDRVQGFHQRKTGSYAKIVGPLVGSKEEVREGDHDMMYESCFISLTRGFYPSLKHVENDLRGIVHQKQTHGVISDPSTVLPPASIPSTKPDPVSHPIRAPPPTSVQHS